MGAIDNTQVVLYDQFDAPIARPHFVGPVPNVVPGALPLSPGPSSGAVVSGRFGAAQGPPPAGFPYWVPIGATYFPPPIDDYALKVDALGVTFKDPFDAATPFPASGIASGFLYDNAPFTFPVIGEGEMAPAHAYDGNPTVLGSETVLGVILRKPFAGGSVPLGTTPAPASDSATHPMRTEETRPTNSTVASVPVALSPGVTTLLVANPARRGVILFNEGSANVFVKLGAGVTTAVYTVRLGPSGLFVLSEPVYTGIITATTAVSGGGPVLVTELIPPSA